MSFIYLYIDTLYYTNILIAISILIFCFNTRRPFLLLLLLEVMYLAINTNFLIYFLFNNFSFGTVYALIILGISAAETIIGTAIILKVYQLKSLESTSFFHTCQ